jgi:hypothetical protein
VWEHAPCLIALASHFYFSPLKNQAAMKKQCFVFAVFACQILHAQRVGIGTTEPAALLHVADSNVVFTATGDVPFSTTVNPPVSGPGRRMMWYPEKAAFRVGQVDNDDWDRDNIGRYSFGAGRRALANGFCAMALGYNAKATGSLTTASGYNSWADGDYSVALGYDAHAGGQQSVAMGSEVFSNGKGAFFFGDSDPHNTGPRGSGTPNEMGMRFNGGYYFITDDVFNFIGVRVPAGGNSWVTISDERLKEKFLPVEGESVLQKISKLHLTTWNYKAQDPKTFRHYGPMAQDFFAAFGTDAYGTIGCDTLINQQDFLGVNLVAIQALEKRTTQHAAENHALKELNARLAASQEALTARLAKLERLLLVKQ